MQPSRAPKYIYKCRIGDNTFINEKTSIKESFIGNNTIVEPKTRISKSVIMGNVKISEK